MYETYNTCTNRTPLPIYIIVSNNVIMYTLYNVQNVHCENNKKAVHIFGVSKFYT